MRTLNSLNWWRAALAGSQPKFDPDQPARGWYRARRKGEEYKPCAYWYDELDALQCLWDGKEIEETTARKMWLWVHKNPVSYETYEAVSAGGAWPDIDPTVAALQLVSSNQPSDDPVEDFRKKIDEASRGADAYANVTSDDMATQAQTLRAHLLKLHKDADDKREEEKKPFFDEAKAVDTRWQPVVKKAKEFADKIRSAIAAWETKKLQEQAKKKPPASDAPTSVTEPERTTIKGASGRAASVKPRRMATAITNLDAFMTSVKGRPELEPLLLSLAQKILDENNDVLGVSIETRAEVR